MQPFRFKQFTIQQSRTAMKVGFDGVLLGAWTDVHGCQRILDVGTGTGLVALMLAQRTSDASRREQTKVELGVEIDAIEFNAAAASDCLQNFSDSRWQNRLKLVHDRFQNWIPRAAHRYDLIVSNPPYFQAEARNRATPRATARHDRELSIDDLLYGASTLLTTRGRLSLILPTTRTAKVIESAKQFGFFWSRRLSVRSLPDKSPHRDLLEFRFTRGDVEHEQLTIEREHHHYTEDFRALAQDFYLAF